jgi:hypothetical protein
MRTPSGIEGDPVVIVAILPRAPAADDVDPEARVPAFGTTGRARVQAQRDRSLVFAVAQRPDCAGRVDPRSFRQAEHPPGIATTVGPGYLG